MRHVISALVNNQPGVLSRVVALFTGRAFNIESLNVAETLDPTISRLTLVTNGNDSIVEQIIKQLNKLVDVIKVMDLTGTEYVDREMALIKVTAEAAARAEILRIVDIFRAQVVDLSLKSYTVEITGDEKKIQGIIDLLNSFGITEIVRTGKVAISRSKREGTTIQNPAPKETHKITAERKATPKEEGNGEDQFRRS
jgi:acetolactate synthase I/III small subunit